CRADWSERVGMIRCAAVPWTIHQINAITFLRVIVSPAGLAVACTHVVEHLTAASVDQNHSMGMADLGGNQILNVHLAADDGSIRHVFVFRPNPKEALIGE